VEQFETGDADFKFLQAHLDLGNRFVIDVSCSSRIVLDGSSPSGNRLEPNMDEAD
jgi:hypothetical protein